MLFENNFLKEINFFRGIWSHHFGNMTILNFGKTYIFPNLEG